FSRNAKYAERLVFYEKLERSNLFTTVDKAVIFFTLKRPIYQCLYYLPYVQEQHLQSDYITPTWPTGPSNSGLLRQKREEPSLEEREERFRRVAPRFFVPTLRVQVLGSEEQESGSSLRS
ncbi:MAG: hypothetical protein GX457_14185, partial [Thermotogaceae bacterium]|nr:hypothetical protein [Thermotogaceae bacterium]